jgi:L-threonylcarbamoyladenylate synthase
MNQKIFEIVEALNEGKVILYPTDTIWGIGCDATNPEAIKKVYDIKQRPYDKPMIILVGDIDMLREYTEEVNVRLLKKILEFEEPTTIVYPKAMNLPDILLEKDGSIAIRIVKHDLMTEVLNLFGKPIVSTSANLSGEPYPRKFKHISEKLKSMVDYIVDYDDSNTPEDIKPSAIYTISGHKLKKIR